MRGSQGKEESWAAQEFESVQLGDKRNRKSLVRIAEMLSKQPTFSINRACGDWSAVKAAYRLFDRDTVVPEEILKVHAIQTSKRCAEAKGVVLAIQDTTFINYDSHEQTTGLGGIGSNKSSTTQGLIMHSTLAVSDEGVPLGLLHQKIYSRLDHGKKWEKRSRLNSRRSIGIEQKESYRWLEALRATFKGLGNEIEVVSVADREADIFEFFSEAANLGTDVLVRLAQNRGVVGEDQRLYPWLESLPESGEMDVEVLPQNGKPGRIAKVGIRFGETQIRPPEYLKALKPITVSVVWVREKTESTKNILEWILLSTKQVTTTEQAIEKIDWYKKRWTIEQYHKVLKSGCSIEECRLQTADRLTRFLTVMSIIAWRIYWIKANIKEPKLPATIALTESEWKALYSCTHKTKQVPQTPPTIQQALIWIAKLGGFLGRKSDGNPGLTTIWRGLIRLHDLTTMWEIQNCG